jgi:phosphotransferase system HPr-like phosphotransfer protein
MEIKHSERKNKKILFVYRDYPSDTSGYKDTMHIIESLKEKYEVATYCDLDEKVINLISAVSRDKQFSAMVTHVPYESSSGRTLGVSHFMRERIELSEAYQDSLLILRQIKMLMDIPIIAYTGAGESPIIANLFWEGGGIDHIVPKTTDLQKDSKEITSNLKALIQRYEKLPLVIPGPVIKTEGDFSIAEVRVNLNTGVGLVSAAAIAKECRRYKGRVLFRKSNNTRKAETYDAKIALDFLAAPILEGEKITINVEGTDEKAKSLIKHLYSVFSSRYPFTMNLKKLEIKENVKEK